MAKITTIIDIGSNSMRMVVFKKTSRFAFHLINETKSKVKISENSYQDNGYLQEIPMERAFHAMESFIHIAKNLKSRKILCVATSALRDAPNRNIFLSKVKKELGIDIKVIDGEKEAYYGAVGASNLLKDNNFTTVDIGGGSTEFALVVKKNIVKTISLNIGTVRLKELFFDKDDLNGAKQYIINQLSTLPNEYKEIGKVVGLGGTARALSRAIIINSKHPFDSLHGFSYKTENAATLFENILDAKSTNKLLSLGIRADRYDTIKTGTFIFKTILEYLNVKNVVTSGVGVREGVYLTDILRTSNHKLPSNFQISVRSLLDRFVDDEKQTAYLGNNIGKLFDVLAPIHNLENKYKSFLVIAAKLQQIGISLNYYKNTELSANFILNGLNYGFSHEERILISTIIKYSTKKLPKESDIKDFRNLLPELKIIRWLSYIHSLNSILNTEYLKYRYNYQLDGKTLIISSSHKHYIIQDEIQKLDKIDNFEVKFLFNRD
jgi:exopolyphosphatase/guanosine-5'-triphosphate,3'-diphosphate pyrophosphatase